MPKLDFILSNSIIWKIKGDFLNFSLWFNFLGRFFFNLRLLWWLSLSLYLIDNANWFFHWNEWMFENGGLLFCILFFYCSTASTYHYYWHMDLFYQWFLFMPLKLWQLTFIYLRFFLIETKRICIVVFHQNRVHYFVIKRGIIYC